MYRIRQMSQHPSVEQESIFQAVIGIRIKTIQMQPLYRGSIKITTICIK